jgi:hypothetical protein
MRKPFSILGNDWSEFIANLLLLIIVGPLYIFLWLLVMIWGVVGWVFRFPSPKQIPVVIEDDYMSSERKFEIYRERFQKEIDGLEIQHMDESMCLKTRQAAVNLRRDDFMVSIQLEGSDEKLDTGFWHTAEEENIDMFFWFAVAALRNGVLYKKNVFGRSVGWAYSKEMSVWMGVSTNSAKHFSSFTKFARRIKA